MRHWSLMEMACCPFRSRPSWWSQLPGGTLRSSRQVTKLMCPSFRLAHRAMSGGNRFDLPVTYSSCVCLSADVLITRQCNPSRDNCQHSETEFAQQHGSATSNGRRAAIACRVHLFVQDQNGTSSSFGCSDPSSSSYVNVNSSSFSISSSISGLLPRKRSAR